MIVVTDALCSSADDPRDAVFHLYHELTPFRLRRLPVPM